MKVKSSWDLGKCCWQNFKQTKSDREFRKLLSWHLISQILSLQDVSGVPFGVSKGFCQWHFFSFLKFIYFNSMSKSTSQRREIKYFNIGFLVICVLYTKYFCMILMSELCVLVYFLMTLPTANEVEKIKIKTNRIQIST